MAAARHTTNVPLGKEDVLLVIASQPNKSSKSLNGLHIHFGKLLKCSRFHMSKNHRWAKAVVQPRRQWNTRKR
jgi:hypothetical protein